jgi:eukaryotic-like serine/threonine-protein kinase
VHGSTSGCTVIHRMRRFRLNKMSMSPEQRWQRVQDLCERAERQPPDYQGAFLEAAEPDPEIRAEAVAMLAALQAEEQARLAALPELPPAAPAMPETIGPYRLTGLLGRGGAGTVYAAEVERAGVPMRLAVKLMHAHLDDADALMRFRREQQILAKLNHPFIVRILDAGLTPEQCPYLAMERVDGLPIDQYCDNAGLGLRARVRLMIDVCRAVDCAHRALVVHLDLKPSNLMVTAEGDPKLLDFGTAKLLDPLGEHTTTRQLTPLYASPEQLRGEPVTTACDVYALGLILFELLAGTWPFGNRTSLVAVSDRAAGNTVPLALPGAVTEQTARARGATLAAVRSQLRGDLERIAAKALESDPARRYTTAAELAADLSRYLEGRPVLARRQTTLYRVSKYAARNRGALSLTAGLLIALVTMAVYAFWQQREALRTAREAQATGQYLTWIFQSANPVSGGRQGMTVAELAQRAEARLGQDPRLDAGLAAALRGVFGAFLYSSGQLEPGLAAVRTAVEQARRSGRAEARIATLQQMADLETAVGRCKEAVALQQEAEQVVRQAGRRLPAAIHVAYLANRGASKAICEQDRAGALALTTAAVARLPEVSDASLDIPMPPRLFKSLVLSLHGQFLAAALRTDEARAALDRALAMAQSDPGVRITIFRSLAALEYSAGSAERAAEALRQAADLAPGVTSPFEELRLRVMWARRLAEAGQKQRAVEITAATLEESRRRAAEVGSLQWMLAGDAAMAYFNANECGPVLELGQEMERITGGQMPPQWRGNQKAAEGLCLTEMGQVTEARARLEEAEALLSPLAGPESRWLRQIRAALAVR